MQAGLQGLEQLVPELAASTAQAMGTPSVAQPPGPLQEAGPSHDSEQPSGEQPEVRACNVKLQEIRQMYRSAHCLGCVKGFAEAGPLHNSSSSPQTSTQTTSGEVLYLALPCLTS